MVIGISSKLEQNHFTFLMIVYFCDFLLIFYFFCHSCILFHFPLLIKGTVSRDFWPRFFHGSALYWPLILRLKVFSFLFHFHEIIGIFRWIRAVGHAGIQKYFFEDSKTNGKIRYISGPAHHDMNDFQVTVPGQQSFENWHLNPRSSNWITL